MADASTSTASPATGAAAVLTAIDHEQAQDAAAVSTEAPMSLFHDDDAAANADLLHVLTRVHVVCRERPQITGLLHVMMNIDAFLYYPQLNHTTLEDAVAEDNLHLLRRLLADATNQMSSSYQHPFYLGMQITKAARMAVKKQRSSPHFKLFLQCLHAVNPEAVGGNEVFAEAAAAGDLELIKWLHIKCPLDSDFVDSSEAAQRAGGNGHVQVLEWLFANRWSSKSRFPLKEVVENNHHDVLKWLDDQDLHAFSEHPVRVLVESSAFKAAAGRGDIEMLTWLFNHPRDESVTYAGDAAAAGGHVSVLEWLYELHPEEGQCYLNGYVGAARNGHLDVLRWLYSHYPKRHWSETMRAAARAGHLEIVRFLHEQSDENDTVDHAVAASAGIHLEILKFLYPLYPMETFQSMQGAAATGNLEVVKWLHETTQNEEFTYPNVVNLAVMEGHVHVLEYIFPHLRADRNRMWLIGSAVHGGRVHVLEWLHEKLAELNSRMENPPQGLERWRVGHDGNRSLPMNDAAREGDVEIIKWLDTHGYGESSALAMDWAASGGHLDAVKWLHENRDEGCSTDAMNSAAENGHLEVVKWLHANRTEGCTTDAVDLAVRNGHAQVVEFLLKNRVEGFTSAVARDAIEIRRDAELIHLLFEYKRDLIDVEKARAHAEGNEAVLRWLREVGEMRFGRDD